MNQRTGHDEKVEERLWKEIEDSRIGMLGVTRPEPQHLQPMTAFGEPEEQAIWFFSSRHTDLVKQAGDGAPAMFCLTAKDRKLYACLAGDLSEQIDRSRIEKYWNPIVAAWYPDGKDDPNLTLLRLDLIDAQVWLVEQGPVKFAWEVAKANLTKNYPDEGSRAHLTFQ